MIIWTQEKKIRPRTSKIEAQPGVRVWTCDWTIPWSAYWTGNKYPAKFTIFPPRATWKSNNEVFLARSCSGTSADDENNLKFLIGKVLLKLRERHDLSKYISNDQLEDDRMTDARARIGIFLNVISCCVNEEVSTFMFVYGSPFSLLWRVEFLFIFVFSLRYAHDTTYTWIWRKRERNKISLEWSRSSG